MVNLTKQIEENRKELLSILQQMEVFNTKAPEGSLRISKSKKGNERYYHIMKNQETGSITERYISKKQEMSFIEQLAQKKYLESLKPVLEKELALLEKMKAEYAPEEKEKVFARLSEERKKLIVPLFTSTEEKYMKWRSDNYPVYMEHPESLKYETDRGEMVRSKSELIIANMLYQYRDQIHYRYEDTLELKKSQFSIHPDFSIMSRKTGKIKYWEHAGGMSFGDYVDDFVRKINAYIKEEIVPGKDLIVTYETREVPLDVSVVRKIIQMYF